MFSFSFFLLFVFSRTSRFPIFLTCVLTFLFKATLNVNAASDDSYYSLPVFNCTTRPSSYRQVAQQGSEVQLAEEV